VQDLLSELKGRTVYLAYGKGSRGRLKSLIQRIEKKAVRIGHYLIRMA